jgi:uncharacterized protein (DUF1684 family)
MRRAIVLGLLLATAACRRVEQPQPQQPNERQEIMKWRSDRAARLKAPEGWLSLIGLHWLVEGPNTFGSDPSGTIVFKAKVPPRLGTLNLSKGVTTLEPAAGAGLTIDGKPVTAPVVLIPDSDPKGPTVVQVGTVRFQVIRRNERFGLRVKDSESEPRANFRGIDYFPIDPKWRVEARFEPFNPPRHIAMPNVLGITTDEIAPGMLAFTVGGKEYRIEPILEEGTKDYFIVFKDATSGKDTYHAARFVYAPPADKSGRTFIDFNKAYNPPCAFTPYATCPLPPPENRLPFRVEAGEKKYAGGYE